MVTGGCKELGHDFEWDETRKSLVCKRCNKTPYELGILGRV